MKRIVRRPLPPSRSRARAITARTSSTRAETAEISSNAAPVRSATMRAIVVFPVPGGPNRIIDGGRSSSIASRSAEPGPSTCCWPTSSSSVDGRRRTASGAFSAWRSRAASVKRSPTREVCWRRPDDAPRRGHGAPAGAASARHRQPARERDAAAELLRDYFARNGIECRALRTRARPREPRRPIEGGDGPSLAFLSHTDTVLADPAEWERDPWSGDLVDGEVWGRGALDMKDQVAASAVAFASLAREGFEPSGDLIFVVGRRRGGRGVDGYGLGLAGSCETHPDAARCDYAINEGGGERLVLDGTPSTCARRRRRCRRRSRCGARTERPCVDARDRRQRAREGRALPRGARGVRAAAGADPRGEGLARGGAGRGSPARRGARARRQLHPMLPALVEPLLAFTLSPTMIDASHQRNVIPAVCEITVDCRLLPEQTPADVEPLIRAALGNGGYELEFSEAVGGTRSPLDTPLWDALEQFTAEHRAGRSARARSPARVHRQPLPARGVRHDRIRLLPDEDHGHGARDEARPLGERAHRGRRPRARRRHASLRRARLAARRRERDRRRTRRLRHHRRPRPAQHAAGALRPTEQGLLTCPVIGVGRRPVREEELAAARDGGDRGREEGQPRREGAGRPSSRD